MGVYCSSSRKTMNEISALQLMSLLLAQVLAELNRAGKNSNTSLWISGEPSANFSSSKGSGNTYHVSFMVSREQVLASFVSFLSHPFLSEGIHHGGEVEVQKSNKSWNQSIILGPHTDYRPCRKGSVTMPLPPGNPVPSTCQGEGGGAAPFHRNRKQCLLAEPSVLLSLTISLLYKACL